MNYFKKYFPSVKDSNIRILLSQHTLWLIPHSICHNAFWWAAGWQQGMGKTINTSCHNNNRSHFTEATTFQIWFLSEASSYAIPPKFMNSQVNTISFIYNIFSFIYIPVFGVFLSSFIALGTPFFAHNKSPSLNSTFYHPPMYDPAETLVTPPLITIHIICL